MPGQWERMDQLLRGLTDQKHRKSSPDIYNIKKGLDKQCLGLTSIASWGRNDHYSLFRKMKLRELLKDIGLNYPEKEGTTPVMKIILLSSLNDTRSLTLIHNIGCMVPLESLGHLLL